MVESMLHIDKRCCGSKRAVVSDEKQVLRRMTRAELRGADRLYRRATIDALPDNVLLETFGFYLGKGDPHEINSHKYYEWQKLVHVCHRWRCIVLASPRRLDLKIYCFWTPRRSVSSKTLDIWPALPIVIHAQDVLSGEGVSTIIAALRHHNRVCKIYYHHRGFQDSLLKEFAAIDGPFPVLTSLALFSFAKNVPILPDSFLGGSAPRLRSLALYGIPYPSIGKLLPSTTNLVHLSLCGIPHSGYISPETIVPCLSTLSRLESIRLEFRFPRSQAHRASRHPPPLTHVVFPNLTSLHFRGDIEYLEDIQSQIETPVLNKTYLTFFNQLVFDTPLLGHFIRRTGAFMTIHTAHIEFFSSYVGVTLSGQEEMDDNNTETLDLDLRISCKPLDWQLSALAQVLNSLLSSLPTLESLKITVPREDWQGDIEATQWQELLHPFISVKEMTLVREVSARLIAPFLQELSASGEGATEVLPALQDLSFDVGYWLRSGPVDAAIDQFATTRRFYGHPFNLRFYDNESEEWVSEGR